MLRCCCSYINRKRIVLRILVYTPSLNPWYIDMVVCGCIYIFMCILFMLLLLLHIVCYLNGRMLFFANICRCMNVCAESALNGSSILIVWFDMQHYGKSTKRPKQQQNQNRIKKQSQIYIYTPLLSLERSPTSFLFLLKHKLQRVFHLACI